MLRMISTKLKEWIKGMKDRIHPGDGEGDVEIGGSLSADGNIITDNAVEAGLISTDQLKPASASDAIEIRDKTNGSIRGYIYLKDANEILALTDSTKKTGLIIDPNDTACIGYFNNEGGPQPARGFGAGRTYLFIASNGVTAHIKMETDEISLTSTAGTGTLLANEFERNEKFIASHYTLALNATSDLGTDTSGNITFTGSAASMVWIKGEYTGVLIHGGVIVGPCYLNIASSTEATLSYQNPLGLNLASGEYIANLTKILTN